MNGPCGEWVVGCPHEHGLETKAESRALCENHSCVTCYAREYKGEEAESTAEQRREFETGAVRDNATHDVCYEAVRQFGENNQIVKLLEELAELQEAVLKFIDGRDSKYHVAEEIADVQIMLCQLGIIMGCGNEADEWEAIKIKRLKSKLG